MSLCPFLHLSVCLFLDLYVCKFSLYLSVCLFLSLLTPLSLVDPSPLSTFYLVKDSARNLSHSLSFGEHTDLI